MDHSKRAESPEQNIVEISKTLPIIPFLKEDKLTLKFFVARVEQLIADYNELNKEYKDMSGRYTASLWEDK